MVLRLADDHAIPPTASSYWIVPGRLLAGAYPGDSDPETHRVKVQALIDAGIRTFVNLMEEDETNHRRLDDGRQSGLRPLLGRCRPDRHRHRLLAAAARTG
jgi:hypothetical protein